MLNSALQFRRISAREALRDAVMALQREHIESASLDARLLLQHVLGVSCEEWLASGTVPLDSRQESEYRALVARRARRQPVAQLIGKREFWGMPFTVTGDTLDPRADSETLIEAVLERVADRQAALRVLDLGTGTGCLLLALLKELPQASGVGVDISDAALAVAKENAERLKMAERVSLRQSCWGEKVQERFDIIVSNPPYIPASVIPTLAPEVSRYEPNLALDGGRDGLDAYRILLPQLPQLLATGGMAVLEFGMGQQKDIETIAAACGLAVAGGKQDLGGVPRCIIINQNGVPIK